MNKTRNCPYCLRPQVLVDIPGIGWRYKHRFNYDSKNCEKVNKRILGGMRKIENKGEKMKEKETKALRDKVIDYVYQENSVTIEEIAHEMLISQEQAKEILDALIKEKLISNFEDEYYPLG